MISFKTKRDAFAGMLTLLGLVLLFGAAGWIAFAEMPSERLPASKRIWARNISTLDKEIDAQEKNNAMAESAAVDLLWKGSAEEVGPLALASVTKLALSRHMKIVSFRPQKSSDLLGLTQIPFNLAVDGAYPDFMQLVKDLETTNSKLAVSLVQINSADAASNHVTGTINFVAYLRAATPAVAPKGGANAQKS